MGRDAIRGVDMCGLPLTASYMSFEQGDSRHGMALEVFETTQHFFGFSGRKSIDMRRSSLLCCM